MEGSTSGGCGIGGARSSFPSILVMRRVLNIWTHACYTDAGNSSHCMSIVCFVWNIKTPKNGQLSTHAQELAGSFGRCTRSDDRCD